MTVEVRMEKMIENLTDTQYLLLVYAVPMGVLGVAFLVSAWMMERQEKKKHYKLNRRKKA